MLSFGYANFEIFKEINAKNAKLEDSQKALMEITPTGQQARISELEKERGLDKAEIAKLKEELEDRKITDEIKTYLFTRLKSSSKKSIIRVLYSPTPEAYTFALQLAHTLEDAGWTMDMDHPGVIKGDKLMTQFRGNEIDLKATPGTELEGEAKDIISALSCVGVHLMPIANSELEPDKIILTIGDKIPGQLISLKDDKDCKTR